MDYEGIPEEHLGFAEAVWDSRLADPMPTFRRLSDATGVPVEALVHYALSRWAAAGSEALMAIEPSVISDLAAAREAEDWPKVAGIIDWLRAGLEDPSSR